MTNVRDILERARAAGAKLSPSEASVLFASAVRLAAAQGATLRPHLVQIDEAGAVHVAPFDERAQEADPGYLAPEAHGADAPKRTEGLVQVFAAGALGYELFTGRRATGRPPGPELTGPLTDVIRVALAADRRERFPDLRRLRDAIDVVQPRAPAEGERSILSALRMRATRAPPEKEALAKLIEKVHQIEEQVQLLGKAQTRLEAAHRETAEHLERFTEGQARLGKARSAPSMLGPALLAAGIAVAGTVAVAWATGLFGGNAGRPGGAVPAHTEAPAPAEPAAVPDAGVAEPPVREAASPAAVDAGALAGPAADAGAPAAPAPGETRAAAEDAGVPDASVAAAEPPPPEAPTTAAPPPPRAIADGARAPAQSGPPAAVTKKRAPVSAQAAMQRALATSQVRRGEAALEEGRADVALDSFRAALETEPNNAPALRGMGRAYEMQGNDPQAVQAYEKYLRIAPGASDARDVRKSIGQLRGRGKLGSGEK